MPWHRLMERGELQPGRYIGTTTDYAAYVHFLFVPFGVWAMTVGFFGVRATCPSSHVLSLTDSTLYNARMLFSATACQTAAHSSLLFTLAIWLSAAMVQEAGQALVGIVWVAALLVSSLSLYMLFVVWSYKAKLHLAAAGHTDAAMHLVKGSNAVVPVASPVDIESNAPGTPVSNGAPAYGSTHGSGSGSTPLLSKPPPGDKHGWGAVGSAKNLKPLDGNAHK